MTYSKETKQGLKIVAKLETEDGTYVVAQQKRGDYCWGSYYNEETGSWAQGHYDYDNKKDAIKDMTKFALYVKIIDPDEYTLTEMIKNFNHNTIQEDKELNRTEADYEEWRDELLYTLQDEIQNGYKEYVGQRQEDINS